MSRPAELPQARRADPPARGPRRWGGRLGERVVAHLHGWSLSWRLIAVLVVLLTAAMTLASLASSALMRAYLVDRTNQELRVAAEPVARKVFDQLAAYATTINGLPSSYAVVFMADSGAPVVRVYPVDERFQPDIPNLSSEDARVTSGEPFTVASTIGEARWQVLAGPLESRNGTYAVAASLSGVEQTVDQMRGLAAAIGLVVLAACVLIGWFAINRAFRPLRAIEDTAAAIAAGDLTRRAPEHAAQDEVASLSRSFNAMLAHVESSFAVREASEERMRRFVTDASHELRTPLATVRGYAELYRQGAAAGPEATAAAMRRIEDEATRMSGLVDDLLLLARIDNRRPFEAGPVDLTVLASDAVQDARVRDPQRPIRLRGGGDRPLAPTPVHGDEARLRQVVANLVANALRHTPGDCPVEVAVGAAGGSAVLEVRDHGPGVPPGDQGKVFERFFRGDPARGRQERGGHGLGLAIVAAIVEAHHGRVSLEPTPGGGATFRVELPAGPPVHSPRSGLMEAMPTRL